MKRSNSLKSIPVVITTAEQSEMADLKSLNLGANVITHKPLNPTLLLKHIDNLVSAYRERKNEVKQYMLQKSLIGNRSKTFLCTYYFQTKKVEIGETYLKYVGEDFPSIFSDYPFRIDHFVLPADYDRVRNFFDVSDMERSHEEIEVRFRVDDTRYEWFEINKMVNYDIMYP